ncbi:hypothetical protein VNO77_40195 [Canavalia gladiata]|uniref:rhamnogalacturonan endolyase n=1 Tax=Canavalia gladiata TaxID=3824 RepID=A0AAN9PRT7_CANGL
MKGLSVHLLRFSITIVINGLCGKDIGECEGSSSSLSSLFGYCANIAFSMEGNEATPATPPVTLNTNNSNLVVIRNGIVTLSLSNPGGDITGISHDGIDNILDTENPKDNRGYFDYDWGDLDGNGGGQRLHGTKFTIIEQNDNIVEVSFSRTSIGSNIAVNTDKRYILRRGDSGFYSYVIFDRPAGLPALKFGQIRYVFKLNGERFHYMAVSNTRQRLMPTPNDRKTGQPLAYPEAVLLTHPSNPQFKGQVDDKYFYSAENKDSLVHGWITIDSKAPVGFWMITPSNEYRSHGPTKQDLTSHCGPTMLNMFLSTHYTGRNSHIVFQKGEPYRKVFGPIFSYINTVPNKADFRSLWSDAVEQQSREAASWPYDFVHAKEFFKANQRGTVGGQFLVQDGAGKPQPAINAYIGLALPGDAGSWQTEGKGYQFWTQTAKNGDFVIKNIVPGDYNLYAWVPGFIGDFVYKNTVTIKPGGNINLNSIVYNPPRIGPTLWEIGIPDRSAAEFFIPDAVPPHINNLDSTDGGEKWRHYGLWQRYADLYPKNDLVFTVGVSDYKKDWFFAHVTRNVGPKKYVPTTWQIVFNLQNVLTGNYTLQLALAGASGSILEVRFNKPNANPPHFTSNVIGDGNVIARHGIHGLHKRFTISVPSHLLVKGSNIVYLLQENAESPFQGVLYDYIRLESPPRRTP